jgi:RNA polymerase sigma-70 factor (ECF subfamily)
MTALSSVFTGSRRTLKDPITTPPNMVTYPMTREAFSDAYDSYANEIFRHCYFRVSDRELAKNFLQETFIRTWKYLTEKNEIKNLRAFLYKVATNLMINDARKKKPISLEALQEQGFDPGGDDENIGRDWVAEANAMTALQAIEEPYRSALTLRYIEGFLPAEIAEITSVNANLVSVRINRGLKQLRIALEPKKNLDFFSVEPYIPIRPEIKMILVPI